MRTRAIAADQRILVISDLHLGDGNATESFARQDARLLAFLRHEAPRADSLVIAGDGFDLAQAFSIARIRRAHRAVFDALARLSRRMPVYYLQGNHDGAAGDLAPALDLRFAEALQIGDGIRIEHGHRLDPRNQPGDRHAFRGARVHACLERVIRSPVRIPMRKHYYWSTRLGHWLFYRYGQYRAARARVHRALGQDAEAARCLAFLDYWGQGEWGDNHALLAAVPAELAAAPYHTLVCGHSHEAGRIRFPEGTYVNTGSWTYGDATYAVCDHGEVRARRWPEGSDITDEEYRGVLGPHRESSFFDWWAAHYRGWLRYDVEAMHCAARGTRSQ
jgi:UDP-2,3-diacylglucosamine pyrophosphatase LpxH